MGWGGHHCGMCWLENSSSRVLGWGGVDTIVVCAVCSRVLGCGGRGGIGSFCLSIVLHSQGQVHMWF